MSVASAGIFHLCGLRRELVGVANVAGKKNIIIEDYWMPSKLIKDFLLE